MACHAHFWGGHDFDNYRGCLSHGDYSSIWTTVPVNRSDNMRNDDIGSVEVGPYTKVILYQHSGFGGLSKELDNRSSASQARYNLQDFNQNNCGNRDDWDDCTSSIKVIHEPTRLHNLCTSTSGIGNSECDTWCQNPSNAQSCHTTRTSYCTANASRLIGATCRGYYDEAESFNMNMAQYNTAWQNHCLANNTNLTSTACVNHYRDNRNNINYSAYETAWENYCTTGGGHNDPLCACIISEYECAINFDPDCSTSTAITTQNQREMPCPPVLNCNQYINIAPGAIALDNIIGQDCIVAGLAGSGLTNTPTTTPNATTPTTTTPTTTPTTTTPTTTPTTPNSGNREEGLSITMILIIGVFILALVIAMIIVARSNKKAREASTYSQPYEQPYDEPYDPYYDEPYAQYGQY